MTGLFRPRDPAAPYWRVQQSEITAFVEGDKDSGGHRNTVNGWRKVGLGITTVDEVSRITKAEYH